MGPLRRETKQNTKDPNAWRIQEGKLLVLLLLYYYYSQLVVVGTLAKTPCNN